MHDDVKTSILYFYSQDKDKNEYLLKASETYEPLNVNFVDLYQVKIYQDCPEMFQYFHSCHPRRVPHIGATAELVAHSIATQIPCSTTHNLRLPSERRHPR